MSRKVLSLIIIALVYFLFSLLPIDNDLLSKLIVPFLISIVANLVTDWLSDRNARRSAQKGISASLNVHVVSMTRLCSEIMGGVNVMARKNVGPSKADLRKIYSDLSKMNDTVELLSKEVCDD